LQDKGIAKDGDYPYKAQNGKCQYSSKKRAASIKDFKQLYSEKKMKQALETIGPLAVSIHVSKKFKFYKTGIFNQPDCSQKTNHAVSFGH
jgi:Papain family cysteine protease